MFFIYRYNFFCDTCGKQFCRPFELRRHMAVKHGEGEMPYPCDQCEKKFFEPKELRSHIAITHQGEWIRNITGILIFCVEFQELSHLTRDLSQAEKKMNVIEQLAK